MNDTTKQLSENMKETVKLVRELRQHFEDDLVNLIQSMYSDDQCAGELRNYAFDRINGFDTKYKRKLLGKIKGKMKESSLWHNDDVEDFQGWFEEVFEDE